MTDYSKMSDFEVNKRVFKELTGNNPLGYPHDADGRSVGNASNGEYLWYDYCNNPADAWPIIHDSLISIIFDSDGYDTPQSAWCRATSPRGDEYYGDEKKPLRAAMIVFLMMKDAEIKN
ncbi:phage protein NinX family protein [Serratia nevei]|uniref:phage protein NinX family protein n=1 Tax=Serratia nevei TaxID=2703794 RepID=UPI00249BF021|nr:phage protein NinX family protein [Serratia nevei]MDI3149361.1 DUF2591 family protein [Serratia nevei]